MSSTNEHAVTLLISRQVKPGCDIEFERLVEQTIAVASTFQGFLGSQLVHPGEEPGVNDSLYHIVLAFDSQDHLQQWQTSPARALSLAAAAPYIEGDLLMRPVSGLAHWFRTPTRPAQVAPPRWKVAVVSWLGIFPTVYLLFFLLGNLLAPWPQLPRLMLLSALVVGLMTWVIAPQLTRLLKPWLYPGDTAVPEPRKT